MTTEAEAVYTTDEAAAVIRVSRDLIIQAIRSTEANRLKAKKIGKGYRISASALNAWFDGLPDA